MAFFMTETCEKKYNADKCKQHTGKKLFCCETCNKEIISNLKLQKHILTNTYWETLYLWCVWHCLPSENQFSDAHVHTQHKETLSVWEK